MLKWENVLGIIYFSKQIFHRKQSLGVPLLTGWWGALKESLVRAVLPSPSQPEKKKNRLLVPHLGGALEICRWECAAGTLEPLAYTRASFAEFCYPILD